MLLRAGRLSEGSFSEAKDKVGREGKRGNRKMAFATLLSCGPYLHLFIRNLIVDAGLRPLILVGLCIPRIRKVQ